MASALAADLITQDLTWSCVNDTVMGGVSSSAVAADGGAVRFSGTLSLDNNGGFTSVRTAPAALALAGTTGFRVTVRGDGRTYDFTVRRSDVPIRGGSYRVPIATTAGQEQTFQLPLASFQATAFGRPIAAPPLAAAPERISSVGFLLADKSPGDFTLEIVSIEPYTDPDAPAPDTDRSAVYGAFARAIERGVPVYNAGDAGRCAAIYQTAIESVLLLSGDTLTAAERSVLTQALRQSSQQDESAAAWTLRRAMDAVLSTGDTRR